MLSSYQKLWIATTLNGPSLWCAMFHGKYWVKKKKLSYQEKSEKTRCRKCKSCWYN